MKYIYGFFNNEDEQWFQRAHVGKFLKLLNVLLSTESKLTEKRYKTTRFLESRREDNIGKACTNCLRSLNFCFPRWCHRLIT